MFNTLASYLLGNNNNDSNTQNLQYNNPELSNEVVRSNIVAVPDEDEDWLLVVDKEG